MLKKFLIVLFSVFVLSGCRSKLSVEEISFASWGSKTEVEILKKVILDFERKNPEIKVKFIHIPQNYFQKIHLLFASKTPPDVLFINNLYLPIYAEKLLNLSEIINKKDFYEQAILGLSYGSEILAIPRDISILVFYINNDLIKKIPEVWDLESLLDITNNVLENGIYGISFEDDAYYLLPYLSYFGEDFDSIFSPEGSKGYEFYKDLRDKYKVAPKKSQVGSLTPAQMFLDEKIAIYLSGRWMYPKISERARFNWSVVGFPVGQAFLPCDSSGWAISKDSKHKDASIKFLKYLSSNESIQYFTKTGLIVPARKDVARMLDNNEHNEKAFLKTIQHSKNTIVTKDYKKIIDKVNLRIME